MSPDHLGLFDTPPDRRQVRLSLLVVGLLVTAVLNGATFHLQLPRGDQSAVAASSDQSETQRSR